MNEMSELTIGIIGLVLALWAGAAAWSIWSAMGLQKQARATLRQSGRLAKMLETSPAMPLLVRSDGRLEASVRLMHWLGFSEVPAHLSELHSADAGLSRPDLEALSRDVTLAQKTGQGFSRSVAVRGSEKILFIRGGLADGRIAPNSSALLWIFDATESEQEINRLRDERQDALDAFEALSAVIESAPLPMWYRVRTGKLQLVNSAYVAATEASDANAVIEEQLELVESQTSEQLAESTDALVRGGEAVRRQQSVTINGQRRNMLIVDVPIGEQGAAGYAIDLEELESAKRRLAQFGDAQRDLFDRLSAGVVQFDASGALAFYNLPFQRIFSLRQQWLAERPELPRLLDRLREINRVPQVRDFAAWRSEKAQWYQSAEAVEEDWVLPDGTHLHVVAHPTPERGLLIIFEDRTEQVQLASARDTLLRVRTATFDNLFETLAVFGPDGKLNIWNNQFADEWGLEEEFLAKHPHVDSMLQQMAPALRNAARVSEVREAIRTATGERKDVSGRLTRSDGRILEYAVIPLPDGNAMLTMLDISDSVQIEQALRERNAALTEADETKTAFLANMSYEFRTPLTSIGGFAEMLESGIAGNLSDQAKEYVEAILQATKRLSRQIDTVLDLSQSEAGTLPIARAPVDLAALLNDVAHVHGDAAREGKIEIELQLQEGLGVTEADGKRLAQAVGHIVENAVQYTGEGGRVLIHGDGDSDRAVIHVSDNGPGMSAGDQSRALDGFTRSRTKSAPSSRGGLGLPLARQLIRAHGGELELRSEVGRGTLVTISLPRK